MRALTFLCVILSFSSAFCYDRELHSDINPQCQNCNSKNITLLYVRAVGENNTVHNIWDFTYGKPTIIFAVTDNNNTLDVTWQDGLPQTIEFADQPTYSFGVVIDKIWEFSDVNNTGVIDPKNVSCTNKFDTKGMQWERIDLVEEEGQVMVQVRAKSFGHDVHRRKGNITIKLDLYPYTSYAFELPHLIHSANSTLVDIILQNMTMSRGFNESRFALEMLLISTEKKDGCIEVNIRKGLDDEHTPGIFEIIELSTPETSMNGDGGFIQFRPVSYTEALRDVSTSTQVHMGTLFKDRITENTTADIFYSNIKNFTILAEKVFISLGGKGDGFYQRSHYNIWSFTMGYGLPPLEGFSLFVILVISIGLGIPIFLMLLGGVYVCVKRRKKFENQPEILVED